MTFTISSEEILSNRMFDAFRPLSFEILDTYWPLKYRQEN